MQFARKVWRAINMKCGCMWLCRWHTAHKRHCNGPPKPEAALCARLPRQLRAQSSLACHLQADEEGAPPPFLLSCTLAHQMHCSCYSGSSALVTSKALPVWEMYGKPPCEFVVFAVFPAALLCSWHLHCSMRATSYLFLLRGMTARMRLA